MALPIRASIAPYGPGARFAYHLEPLWHGENEAGAGVAVGITAHLLHR